ncbi:MAG: hypothetical protein KA967_07265 [Methanoculleus sp.]|nr:hypothetical protein [Methanoculleus sp.]
MLDRRLLFCLISERALLPSRDARMGIRPGLRPSPSALFSGSSSRDGRSPR